MKFIKKEEFKDSNWSAGVTTEVFIYPEGASVGEKNFDFRISTATCKDKESVYTPYTGFYRYITPIDNVMNIESDGNKFTLDPFEVLFFDGDHSTKSSGDVRDFNLIYKKGQEAKMFSLNINNFEFNADKRAVIFNYDSELKVQGKNFEKFSAIYLGEEKIKIEGKGRIIICEF